MLITLWWYDYYVTQTRLTNWMTLNYMMDHFYVLHPVYGILFLKQSEMLVPYQLLNNLLNYAFKVYRSFRFLIFAPLLTFFLTYILNNILLLISLDCLALRRVCISGNSWLGMRMLSPPHTSCPSGYQAMILRPRYKSNTHLCSVVYCIDTYM